MDFPTSSHKRPRADLPDDSRPDLLQPHVSRLVQNLGWRDCIYKIPPKRCASGDSQRSLLPGLRPFLLFGCVALRGTLRPQGSKSSTFTAAASGCCMVWYFPSVTVGAPRLHRVRSWLPSIYSDAIIPSPSSDADGGQVPFPLRAADGVAALEVHYKLFTTSIYIVTRLVV